MAKQKSLLKDLILIALIMKASTFLIMFLTAHLLPFCYECYVSDFAYLPVYSWSSWLSLGTWDARHYMYLVDIGYSAGVPSNVFYPLFPLLVSVVKLISWMPSTLLAGILTANLISMGVVVVFYLLVKQLFGDKAAFYSSLFLLAFPTAFYLDLMYTEGLFLLLVTSFFLFWEKRSWLPALLVGFLLPLSRPLGILMLLPIVVEALYEGVKKKNYRELFRTHGMLALSILSGFGAYLLFMYLKTDSPWSGFDAQVHFVANNSISNLFHVGDWLCRNFIDINLAIHGITNSILDRLFFVGFLITLWPMQKYVGRKYFVFALVMGLAPAFSGVFMGYMRYLLVVFPLYILFARICKDKTPYVIYPLLMLQVLFLIMHALNYWTA